MISKIDPNDLTLKQLFDQYKQNAKSNSVTETGSIQPSHGTPGPGDQMPDSFNQQNAFDTGESESGKENVLGDLNQLLISVVKDIE